MYEQSNGPRMTPSRIEVEDGRTLAPQDEVRVDLHVHSCHSDRPYSWFLRSGKSAECYTRPETVHDLATRRGMSLVTLCDHDEISGALELCERQPDNTFISEEVSARFPEDGCVMHTIVLGIDEAQHRELQRLRRNIYELVAYMQQEGISHFLCHPLSSVNRRLKVEHVRKALLMFPALEIRNGTRDELHEAELERVLAQLTPHALAEWASDHPEVPFVVRDARYALVGGSDDHGGLAIARAFTSYRGERSIAGLRAAIRERRTVPSGLHGTAETLSHNVYGVLGGYLRDSGQINVAPNATMESIARGLAAGTGTGANAGPRSLLAPLTRHLFTAAARERVTLDLLRNAGHTDEVQRQLLKVAEGSLIQGGRDTLGALMDNISNQRLAAVADALPDVLRTMLLAVPYILGTRYQAADRGTALGIVDALGITRERTTPPRVAIVTDVIDSIDGVSLGLRRLAAAARRAELPLYLVGAGTGDAVHVDDNEIVRVPTVLNKAFEFYPDYAWSVPHLPALMRWFVDEKIDIVQCATPGPMGVMALAAARILGLRVVAQYHTEVPEYATRLTGDPVVGSIMGAVVSWFYRQAELCLAPSQAIAERLIGYGVEPEQVVRVPRGIDLGLFSPDRSDRSIFERWGLGGRPVMLYVGRVSKEKNVDAVIDAYARVRAARPDVALLIVGDGPYAAQIGERAAPLGGVMAGPLSGADLAAVYASADVFAFPSETETFGNVVVEAQASGLPVVVAGGGGAHEQVLQGVTGLVVDGQRPDELATAVLTILADSTLRARMSRAAHRFAQRFDLDAAARGTFAIYRRFLQGERPVAEPEPSVQPAGGTNDADRTVARRVAAPEG